MDRCSIFHNIMDATPIHDLSNVVQIILGKQICYALKNITLFLKQKLITGNYVIFKIKSTKHSSYKV